MHPAPRPPANRHQDEGPRRLPGQGAAVDAPRRADQLAPRRRRRRDARAMPPKDVSLLDVIDAVEPLQRTRGKRGVRASPLQRSSTRRSGRCAKRSPAFRWQTCCPDKSKSAARRRKWPEPRESPRQCEVAFHCWLVQQCEAGTRRHCWTSQQCPVISPSSEITRSRDSRPRRESCTHSHSFAKPAGGRESLPSPRCNRPRGIVHRVNDGRRRSRSPLLVRTCESWRIIVVVALTCCYRST